MSVFGQIMFIVIFAVVVLGGLYVFTKVTLYRQSKKKENDRNASGGTQQSTDEKEEPAFHPFLSRYTNDVHRAEVLLNKMILSKPTGRRQTKDKAETLYETDIISAVLTETREYLAYHQHTKDVTGDDAQNDYMEWTLVKSNAKKTKKLQVDALLNGIPLPDCAGWQVQDGHVTVVDPLGMNGVFEYHRVYGVWDIVTEKTVRHEIGDASISPQHSGKE